MPTFRVEVCTYGPGGQAHMTRYKVGSAVELFDRLMRNKYKRRIDSIYQVVTNERKYYFQSTRMRYCNMKEGVYFDGTDTEALEELAALVWERMLETRGSPR